MGEVDPFDFVLARDLGRSLGEIRDMPHSEWVEWRAFYVWDGAMSDFWARVGAARRG